MGICKQRVTTVWLNMSHWPCTEEFFEKFTNTISFRNNKNSCNGVIEIGLTLHQFFLTDVVAREAQSFYILWGTTGPLIEQLSNCLVTLAQKCVEQMLKSLEL